jgi:hypothetical protein
MRVRESQKHTDPRDPDTEHQDPHYKNKQPDKMNPQSSFHVIIHIYHAFVASKIDRLMNYAVP